MACYTKKNKSGQVFLSGDLGPHCADHRCSWVSAFLCDYPVGDGKTCDRPLCSDHAYEVAPEIHYCDSHHATWKEFVANGGVKEMLENVVPYKPPTQQGERYEW